MANSSAYIGLPYALNVTAIDTNGNTITSYSGTPILSSSDPLSNFSALTFANGVGTGSVIFESIGAQTVTVTDGAMTGTSGPVTVQLPPNFAVTVNTDTTTGTVSNCTDQNASGASADANCSLRDALSAAGAMNGSYPALPIAVTFSPSVFSALNAAAQNTIQLSSAGTLFIPSNTTITGPTAGSGASLANLATVDGATLYTVFTVTSGVTNAAIANLTIQDGLGSGAAGQISGGGIYNNGTLTVSNCTIVNNSAALGGGIENDAGGILNLINCTLSGNTAGQGGGIYNNSGTVNVEGSTVSGNSAGPSTSGGGIYNLGTLTVTSSTISANVTGFAGGGIYSPGAAQPTIANSILSGNWVGTPASVTGYDDVDDGTGGTTFTGGSGDGGGNIVGYYNLFAGPPATAPSPAIYLAALANYGGPTQTMIPLPGSPVICAGLQVNIPANLAGDQRGMVFDPSCPASSVDSGAAQSNYALSFTTEPPANAAVAAAMSPAPVVTVTESGNPLQAGSASVSVTDADNDLVTQPATAGTANGQATFSSLVFGNAEISDTLSATLTLNGAVSTSAVSTSFAVQATTPAVIVTPSSTSISTANGLSVVVVVAGTTGVWPTGSVTLTGGGYSNAQPLSGGSTTFTIAAGQLSAGTIAFTASYIPDSESSSTYNAATGTSPLVVVTQVTQSIAFANPGAQIVGVPLTLSATATSGQAVTLSSETAGVCIVSGATATLIASGTCTIDANQAGNSTYAAAPQVQEIFTVNGEAQTIAFAGLPNQTYGAAPFSLNAAASSGLPVSFASTTFSVCSVSGNTVTLLSGGTCGIAATQAGNSTYAAAPQVQQSFTVSVGTQTITFAAVPSQTYGVAPFSLSATASSGLPVNFASTAPSICTVSGTSVSLLASGTCNISATQPGNSSYAAAPPVSQSFVVHHAIQTLTFASIPATALAVGSVGLNATASSGQPVSFASITPSVCTVSGSTAILLAGGTCTINATQAGDAQYGSVLYARDFAVTLAQQSITFAALPDQTYGAAPFSLNATASSGLPVSFASTTPAACTVSGNAVSLLASGACTISATQPGNSLYSAAPSVLQDFTVHHAIQTITFASIPATALVVGSVSLNATASSGQPISFASTTPSVCTASGSTAFLLSAGTCTIDASQAGDAQYGPVLYARNFTVTLLAQQSITFAALPDQTYGAAPFSLSATASSGLPVNFASTTSSICTVQGSTVSLLASGTCTLSATQPGNSSYAAAPPVPQSFPVHHAIQTLTFASIPATALAVGSVGLNASASSGQPVSFASITPSVCTVSGSTAILLAGGTCIINATQAGNTQYGSVLYARDFTVTLLAQQSITFAALPDQTYGAAPFSLNATASSGLPVSFASTTPAACTVSGNAVSLLASGACTISATQPGNNSYAAAPSVPQSFTVHHATQTITFAAIPAAALLTGSVNLNATASSGLPISFASTTPSLCTASGSTAILLAVGTCIINASQAGNTQYGQASWERSLVITVAPQTIAFTALPPVTFGTAPFAISASASSGLPVSLASASPSICTVSGTTVTLLAGGSSCTIQATQTGNNIYAAAPQVQQSFSVNVGTQSITFAALPDETYGAAPFSLSATASSGLPVSFASTTPSTCTISGSTVSLLASGTCIINATQPGNSAYAAALPVQQGVPVHHATQTIAFAAIPATALATGSVSLNATASSGLPITFASSTPSICTVSGSTATLLAAGTCTIDATQAGTTQYYGPVVYADSFTVAPLAQQSITFAALPDQTYGAAPFSLSATASSGLPVNFASTAPAICTVSGDAVSLLASGTCTISATQPGNSFYSAAPSVQQSFPVHHATQTIAFAVIPAAALLTGSVNLNATASSGLPISFASTTPSLCTASGSTAILLAVGTCIINASQAGNTQYGQASWERSLVITLAPQTITFPAIPAVNYGAVPFAASAGASSGLPVSFASTTPWACTVSGSTVTLVAAGICTVQATQPGNSTYVAAFAVSQSFTVMNVSNPAPIITSIFPQFVIAGSASQNVTLTGRNFLPGTTASYAGAAHTITYVSPTTMVLPLTAADLAAPGVQSIMLISPAPGSGSGAINLPVLYEPDGMLAASQLAAGDQARLQRLIQKGLNGTPVTIATIGGSITAGTGASNAGHNYANLLEDWWNETFPASTSTLVNAGIGGTGSDYGSLRAQRDVLSYNPDLVIVEFAVNDLGSPYGDTYEGLVRQLLDAPSQPAVILLFMMTYQLPVVESNLTAQPWQAVIGANYNVPMVSYFNAISPELTAGNISLAQISADGVHPSDLGHAYAAQFIEQNIQIAIENFAPGAPLEPVPATPSPVYSSDFEFTSLEEGNGTWGAPLNPTNNQGWVAVSTSPGGALNFPDAGLQSSSPGSMLNFTVTGRDILIGYWQSNGPMGEASVTVDGGVPVILDAFYITEAGAHLMSRVANGLADGPHQVQIQLLSTQDAGSTGNTFDVLCVGAGGVF